MSNFDFEIVPISPTPSPSRNRGRTGKKNLGPQGKRIVVSVYHFFQSLADDPTKVEKINFRKVQELTAEACGVSRSTVQSIKRDMDKCEEESTLAEQRNVQIVINKV